MDPRAPALVGAAAVVQHETTPTGGRDALELMALAAEGAVADSGAAAVGAQIDLVLVPRGTWGYTDPGRVVAERLGARDPHTVVSEIGVLQQTLLTRAAGAIADGDARAVLVCGSEAKHRDLRALKAGIELDRSDPSPGDPDEVLAPPGDFWTAMEVERELIAPTHEYAAIESVIAHDEGRSPVQQRAHAAELWSRFAAVAAGNVDAWDRRGLSAAEIATPGPDNRPIAMPYTKLLCSQWNVDQAAAVVMTSAETATGLGIPRDRWVFAHAAAESNQMVPLPKRAVIGSWPACEAVADALGLVGRAARVPDVVELYSCFPAAVEVQAHALGLALDSPLTVSGGMTFGGGPLNNAVLQGLAELVRRLRDDPDALGLITSVSGWLTRTGASLWSATPPADEFRAVDVTAVAAARTEVHPLLPDAVGDATVAAHTVLYDGLEPDRAVAVLDVDGGRTIARCTDAATAKAMTESDWVGRGVSIAAPGVFVAD